MTPPSIIDAVARKCNHARCGAVPWRCDTGTGQSRPEHIPVLADAIVNHLALPPGGIVVDATVGLGGHAARILSSLGNTGRLVGLDVDAENLAVAAQRLAPWADRVELRRRNFSELRAVLDELGIAGVNGIVADLGVSSNQLADAGRGLSFIEDGPLDMRLDDRLTTTAADLVNALPEHELADLFYHNAQEKFSRRIARRICQARREARIRRTGELSRIVCSAIGVDPDSRRSRIHPATRVFLALRMAVNNEAEHLESFLNQAPQCLLPGGRVAVISFQSVEDRVVKRAFRRDEAAGMYRICTKRPITPDAAEIAANPRARSAKLRVAQRVEEA